MFELGAILLYLAWSGMDHSVFWQQIYIHMTPTEYRLRNSSYFAVR